MNIILLVSIIAFILFQSVSRKEYKGVGFTFSMVSCLAAAVFFVLSAGLRFSFEPGIIPYAIGFAISYGMSVVGGFFALKVGSLSLTSLVTNFSLIIPCVYGLVFLKEPSSIFLYTGLTFLFLSFIFINTKKGDNKITLKWGFYITLTFVGGGFCSTVQKMQQVAFDGAYKSEFMIIALLIVSAVLLVFSYFCEKGEIITSIKKGYGWMIGCGVANAAVNLFVMILSGKMATSLMFPLISGGGIIVAWIFSRFVYKEKLTLAQNIGLVFGVIAVVLLNL